MSAGRKHRRRAQRWIVRQPGIEPSAETRAWVGRLVAAHDDDTVTMEEFCELGRQAAEYLLGLPEVERVEAASLVGDHALANLLGRRVRTVAIAKREAS